MKVLKFKDTIEILDLVGTIAGIIMVGIGLYQIYPPAMFIVIGTILALPNISRKAVK
jgi:hypothetical protein